MRRPKGCWSDNGQMIKGRTMETDSNVKREVGSEPGSSNRPEGRRRKNEWQLLDVTPRLTDCTYLGIRSTYQQTHSSSRKAKDHKWDVGDLGTRCEALVQLWPGP